MIKIQQLSNYSSVHHSVFPAAAANLVLAKILKCNQSVLWIV